jgi:hypothetical protein
MLTPALSKRSNISPGQSPAGGSYKFKKGRRYFTKEDRLKEAFAEMHKFYSRQHLGRNLKFDDIKDKGIEKGELNILVKDFDIKIPLGK